MLQQGPTARALTVRYVFALSLVALLSLLGQALIQYAMVQQSSDAHLINVAGRQRMLSQRLSKAALEIEAHPEFGNLEPATDEFRKALELWERSHRNLQHGAPDKGIPGANPPEVRALFAASEQHFQAMRSAGWKLLATLARSDPASVEAGHRARERRADITGPIATILLHEGAFLTSMDDIVLQHQLAAERNVKSLRTIELSLFALTILVLTAEGFLVFRPAVRRVARTITDLTEAREALRDHQAELESKVEQRTEELQRSERQFRTIFESATIGMAQVEPNSGRYLRANPSFCRMLQYREDELLTKTFRELTHPEDRDPDFVHFQRMVSGEITNYRAQKRYLRKDGASVWVQVSSVLLYDSAGRPERTVSIIQDISARLEAEHALRCSEEHFRTLAELVPQIVWTATADLHIDYFNKRWHEYTGLSEASGDGLDLRTAIHSEEQARLDELLKDAQQRNVPFVYEHRLRAADGGYRWHLTRALPLFDEQMRVARWFGTCTDIEDQKQSQLAAENENQSKDEFVALISHELRTPLTAILGWTAIMRKHEKDTALVERASKIIERNARAQAQLVEDLLDMSRIISGKMEIERAPTELQGVVTAAIDTVRPAADHKRIRVDLAQPEQPMTVTGDARRLQQVFWNLLNNAIKFTPEDGHIEIRVETKGTRGAQRVRVRVLDDGRGIAPQFLPHVFERFKQAQEGRARSHGLGLGLAIVQQLVQLHGGTIVAHSDGEGRGACFEVELPVTVEAGGSAREQNMAAPSPRGALRGRGRARARLGSQSARRG